MNKKVFQLFKAYTLSGVEFLNWYHQKTRLVNAFTLAEVLITLGIIGVVAALTIPNLMQTMQNRDLVSKYLKVNNTLTNAYKNAEAINGYKLYSLAPEQFKLKFEEDLKILAGNCENEICLTDGCSYNYICDEEKCTEIIVDTNGKKNPNSAGKDIFRFLITEDGIKAQGEYTDYCGEIDGGMDCGRYILANHKLFDGLVNNCSEYSNGRCSSCNDGYSLEGNSCNTVNLANCEKYSGVTCSGCSDGYILKNGICTSLSDNNCASTIDGKTCEVCSNKYRNNNGVCEEIEIADCKTYSGDSCLECKSGQYKNNGGSCELQEITGCKTYNNGECTEYKAIANCADQTNYTCNSCNSGNYLNANGSCSKIEVANCTSADVNGNCTQCSLGYHSDNNACNKPTYCESIDSNGECTLANNKGTAYLIKDANVYSHGAMQDSTFSNAREICKDKGLDLPDADTFSELLKQKQKDPSSFRCAEVPCGSTHWAVDKNGQVCAVYLNGTKACPANPSNNLSVWCMKPINE